MTTLPLPALDESNTAYWQAGETGSLRILRCQSCRAWIHPPTAVCPDCLSFEVAPEAVSGRATVAAFTINYQKWVPDMEVPFALAIVELDDAPGIRLTTRLVDIAPDEVRCGLATEVVFEHVEDVWLPLFRPTKGAR